MLSRAHHQATEATLTPPQVMLGRTLIAAAKEDVDATPTAAAMAGAIPTPAIETEVEAAEAEAVDLVIAEQAAGTPTVADEEVAAVRATAEGGVMAAAVRTATAHAVMLLRQAKGPAWASPLMVAVVEVPPVAADLVAVARAIHQIAFLLVVVVVVVVVVVTGVARTTTDTMMRRPSLPIIDKKVAVVMLEVAIVTAEPMTTAAAVAAPTLAAVAAAAAAAAAP
mmetsp:Transcript_23443/g.58281  ORF Transcript_23443/g.58281 Transcript_23443/m.58281 type:complete len:224 (+) Transcript_23443:161-832(+)